MDASPAMTADTMPRRILMTADTIGGVWTYALELAGGLALQGVEVALATMGRAPSEEQRRAAAQVPNLQLFESTFRLEWMEDPWDDLQRGGEWLLDLARRFRPDLVHLNGYFHAALPWACPSLVVAHSCLFSWWDAVRGTAASAPFHRYREGVAAGLASAALVVAPSGAMLESLERHYLPIPLGRVINNSRSSSIFRPGKKEELILSCGRIWDEGKNIPTLARAAVSLPWPVCVAGEEQHPEGGAIVVDNVIRLGNLSEVQLASWFGAASIYALPARYEPFGLTILEAAMSRCALVLGDIQSLRELWEDAALFVPPEDEAAIAGALRELCRDSDRREALAEKALQRSRHFSPERMTSEYLGAYRSICG